MSCGAIAVAAGCGKVAPEDVPADARPVDAVPDASVAPPAEVDFTAGDSTAIFGRGDILFEDACPPREAVVGFSGHTGMHGASMVLGQIRVHCGAARIEPAGGGYKLGWTPGAVLPVRGSSAVAPAWAVECPEDHFVTGFKVRSGEAIDQLVVYCTPFALTADSGTWRPAASPSITMNPVGYENGVVRDPAPCGPNQIARTVALRATVVVDAFGIQCGTPSIR